MSDEDEKLVAILDQYFIEIHKQENPFSGGWSNSNIADIFKGDDDYGNSRFGHCCYFCYFLAY